MKQSWREGQGQMMQGQLSHDKGCAQAAPEGSWAREFTLAAAGGLAGVQVGRLSWDQSGGSRDGEKSADMKYMLEGNWQVFLMEWVLGEEKKGKQDSAQVSASSGWGKGSWLSWGTMRKDLGDGGEDGRNTPSRACLIWNAWWEIQLAPVDC